MTNKSSQNDASQSPRWRKDIVKGAAAGLIAAVLCLTMVLCISLVTAVYPKGASASTSPKQTITSPPTAQAFSTQPSSLTAPSTSSLVPSSPTPPISIPIIPPQPTAAPSPYFSLVSQRSKLCIDVQNESIENGAHVWQFNCNGKDNQMWRLQPVGGSYEIIGKSSGKCLGPERASPGAGVNIVQSDCVGGKDQLWNLIAKGPKLFEIHGQASGLCLEVAMASRQAGDYLIEFDCNGGDNQLWAQR